MSSLSVSLLLLVVVAIAIALAYNLRQGAGRRLRLAWWRRGAGSRASGKLTPGNGPHRSDSASANGRRGEPRLEPGAPGNGGDVDVADEPVPASSEQPQAAGEESRPGGERFDAPASAALSDIAPSFDTLESSARAADRVVPAESAPVPDAGAAASPMLSEICDCIVELVPAAPLSGERLLSIAQRFRRAGAKPVAFEARAGEDADGFEAVAAGRSYEIARVGVLLANRHGPLNAMEFSEFISAVQTLATTLSAHAEMPAMGTVLARARDLDSTCAQLDVQISVNVEASEAIEPAQLSALAQPLSLVERGSHRYVRQSPSGEPLFSVAFSDSPSRLTFLLDVPRVAAELEPFARMVQAASACARQLGAQLVDDAGKPLTQTSLAQIARQLGQRYESLEAIGLPAGSTLACKVFN